MKASTPTRGGRTAGSPSSVLTMRRPGKATRVVRKPSGMPSAAAPTTLARESPRLAPSARHSFPSSANRRTASRVHAPGPPTDSESTSASGYTTIHPSRRSSSSPSPSRRRPRLTALAPAAGGARGRRAPRPPGRRGGGGGGRPRPRHFSREPLASGLDQAERLGPQVQPARSGEGAMTRHQPRGRRAGHLDPDQRLLVGDELHGEHARAADEPGDERGGGVVVELLGRPQLLQPPARSRW